MPDFASNPICLCDESALIAWRHYDNSLPSTPLLGHTENAGPTLPTAFPTMLLRHSLVRGSFEHRVYPEHKPLLSAYGLQPENPLHLLVGRKKRSRVALNSVIHSCSMDIPPQSILQLEQNIAIVSPEYLYARMAKHNDLLGQILLGLELTGCYSLRPEEKHGISQHPPFCSKETIAKFLQELGEFPHSKNASKALNYLEDGSGSPRESALYLLLCLPMKHGGFGLPHPKLNFRLPLKKDCNALWTRANAFDLVWKDARLIIEYDGDEAHGTAESRERDILRRNATILAGYTVLVVTKHELSSMEKTYGVAKAAARAIGKELRFRNSDFRAKHEALRKRLLSRHI